MCGHFRAYGLCHAVADAQPQLAGCLLGERDSEDTAVRVATTGHYSAHEPFRQHAGFARTRCGGEHEIA
jgi:hypothetical protein